MTDRRKVLWLFVGSLLVSATIAGWIHGLHAEIGHREAVRIFLSLFVFDDYQAALFMMAVLVVSLAVPGVQSVGMVAIRWVGARPAATAAWTALGLAAGSVLAYKAHPLAMDEYAAVFQSEVFAAGRLFGQMPPELLDWLVPPGFQGHFFRTSHVTGEVASMYWPGFAAILTPFALLGVTWLANPLLGGLLVFLVHRLTLRLTGSLEAAGFAGLLTLASPAVTINAVSFYSMTAHVVCNVAFVLLLLERTAARALLAGVIGSLALVLHNPLPHLLVALPWLIWLAGSADRRRVLPALLAGYVPLSLLAGFGWLHVLAQLQEVPTVAAASAPPAKGFVAASIDRLVSVSVFRMPTLALLEDRLMALAKIWLWAVPGLLLLAIEGARSARSNVLCRLLVWSAIGTLMGFLFVPADQGHGWGFRYFHAAWFVLPVLAVFAVFRIDERGVAMPLATTGDRLAGFVAGCAILSLTVLTGLRLFQVEQHMARHLAQVPDATSGKAAVVLVRSGQGYYATDLVQNDPFLRTGPIRMISHGEEEDAAMLSERFPDVRVLTVGRTATVWGYPSAQYSD